jgi:hypothetical protein
LTCGSSVVIVATYRETLTLIRAFLLAINLFAWWMAATTCESAYARLLETRNPDVATPVANVGG